MVLGGFGFLSRLRGLSIDNLVEAEMVLADGSIVIVNEYEHPGAFETVTSGVSSNTVFWSQISGGQLGVLAPASVLSPDILRRLSRSLWYLQETFSSP